MSIWYKLFFGATILYLAWHLGRYYQWNVETNDRQNVVPFCQNYPTLDYSLEFKSI